MLLHGFCESPAIFDGLLPLLTPHFRILRPVLPGHASLPWDSSLKSISDLADWVAHFLDHINLKSCYLLGHSLGGYIAAAMATQHPGRIDSLLMLHATALEDQKERQQNRNKALSLIERFGVKPFLKAFVESLFHQPKPEWKTELATITSAVAPEAVKALILAMRDRPSSLKGLRESGIPTTYLIGEKDSFVSPSRSKLEFAGWPEVKIVEMANVGHMGMYEAPEKVIDAIRDWIR